MVLEKSPQVLLAALAGHAQNECERQLFDLLYQKYGILGDKVDGLSESYICMNASVPELAPSTIFEVSRCLGDVLKLTAS